MTHLFAICATHRRAPVSLLERFPRGDRVRDVLATLREVPGVDGAVVLSTCNRYELYLSTDRALSGADLAQLVARTAGLDAAEIDAVVDVHRGDDAVHHLFSVSAGLDSRAPGEGEILGQVRTAAQTAAHEGSLDRELDTLVQWAVRAGRRARRAGGSPVGRTSVGDAGVRLMHRHLDGLAGRTVLVVGAGRVAGQAVQRLTDEGARAVVAARDPARAAERFRSHPVVALPLTPAALADVDAVLCATSAPAAILTTAVLRTAVAARRERPLVVVDLAVPRNVEASATGVTGVTLLDLDALPGIGGASAAGFDAARETVRTETTSYLSARAARRAGDLLAGVTSRAEQVRRAELARVESRLSDTQRDLLEEVTRRLVGSLLHPALSGLRGFAEAGELAAAGETAALLGASPPGADSEAEADTQARIAG